MKVFYSNIVSHLLSVALGIILLYHLQLVWRFGYVYIYEENKTIVALEILLAVTIIIFGLAKIVHTAIRKKREIITLEAEAS